MLGIVKNTDIDFRRDTPAQRGGSLRNKTKKEKKPKRSGSGSGSKLASGKAVELYDGKILMTSIQYETLNPVWNETFQL